MRQLAPRTALTRAVEAEELELAYEPIVDLASGGRPRPLTAVDCRTRSLR